MRIRNLINLGVKSVQRTAYVRFIGQATSSEWFDGNLVIFADLDFSFVSLVEFLSFLLASGLG